MTEGTQEPVIKIDNKAERTKEKDADHLRKKVSPTPSQQIRKKVKKSRKKQKLLRPNSPAAYPSPLPIRNEYFDRDRDSRRDNKEQSSRISNEESVVPNKTQSIRTESGTTDSRKNSSSAFLAFRIHYLIVHIAIMLADGLQGTHLYVLYEGYGYTVASLYCLGFVSGAITSPFIGPLVDRVGRRNSAVAYCALEVGINLLEQYDNLFGLIVSRVAGGVTTNLLFTVFESWLVTEHRRRRFPEEKLETIMRDSVVASNLSAIASGCLAHVCASLYGPTGPFSGAVACTFVALLLVATRWEENYGSDVPGMKSITTYMNDAFTTIISDSKIYRIGLIQGLTEGALQTFVFLWSPALRHFAVRIPSNILERGVLGVDENGEPAYGLIFGAFMACGALGGLAEPRVRSFFSFFVSSSPKTEKAKVVVCTRNMSKDVGNRTDSEDGCVSEASDLTISEDGSFSETSSTTRKIIQNEGKNDDSDSEDENEADGDEKPMAVELLASLCFIVCACLLSTPIIVDENNPYAFTMSLGAFLMYEFVVGLYMPCEGVLRSIYMPDDGICSLMTMLRVIVNVAVALGVISTNYIPFTTAFAACSGALILAACIQLSLVQKSEWESLYRCVSKSFSSRHTSVPPSDMASSLTYMSFSTSSTSQSSLMTYDISTSRKNQ